MAGARVNDPGDALSVINEVPDSPTSGHLVLPAFECLAFPRTGAERPFEPVLPFRNCARPGIGPNRFERATQVSGGLHREFVPTSRGVVGSEPQVVLL